MSDTGPRIERLLGRAAGIASGSRLHPAVLVLEVQRAAERSVRDGAVANAYTVSVSTAEAPAFGRHSKQLTRLIETMLDEFAVARGLRKPGPWEVEFLASPETRSGETHVKAAFRNAADASSPPPAGPTQVITRHRGVFLDVSGVGRVRLTHTPFTIGRGRECDLAIADLSISRHHARIESLSDGSLLMRDLGSRNLLVVNGERVAQVVLSPGLAVTLGDTALRVEVEPEG